MDLDLHAALDRVRDRETFLDFVDALVRDREQAVSREKQQPTAYLGVCSDAGGWYSFSIEEYLDASLAWALDSGARWPEGNSEAELWQAFATFLYVGKIYE